MRSDEVRRELRGFYEHEAAAESRRPPSGRRVEACRAFAAEVCVARDGDPLGVVDIGAGPAIDAEHFVDAGLSYAGVDLAVANAALARRRDHVVVAASMFDLPFDDRSFDAGWSMSTLMHVPAAEVSVVLCEFARVLHPGAPVGIGQWGGELGDVMSDFSDTSEHRRLFSLRRPDLNRELLSSLGEVERFEVWDVGPVGWEYHFAVIRT